MRVELRREPLDLLRRHDDLAAGEALADVQIVEVADLDEALDALSELGGDTSGITDLAAAAPAG